jgi:hypothetical protein
MGRPVVFRGAGLADRRFQGDRRAATAASLPIVNHSLPPQPGFPTGADRRGRGPVRAAGAEHAARSSDPSEAGQPNRPRPTGRLNRNYTFDRRQNRPRHPSPRKPGRRRADARRLAPRLFLGAAPENSGKPRRSADCNRHTASFNRRTALLGPLNPSAERAEPPRCPSPIGSGRSSPTQQSRPTTTI